MSETKGEMSRRQLLKMASPLGKVMLEKAGCTGCGLCVAECDTGALAISSSEGSDVFRVIFKHSNCLACNRCVEICPEKCLRMERILELDKMAGQSVLFEDKIVRCSGCGSPIGPEVMIDKLRARIAAAGQPLPSRFDLCPACKVQAQFSELRM